ncbi:MAG: hypothetical protein QNJ05_07420 [Woeseiaceae bacterium]|nr:hypothetical protein [Woeseiaceae bacterium]
MQRERRKTLLQTDKVSVSVIERLSLEVTSLRNGGYVAGSLAPVAIEIVSGDGPARVVYLDCRPGEAVTMGSVL